MAETTRPTSGTPTQTTSTSTTPGTSSGTATGGARNPANPSVAASGPAGARSSATASTANQGGSQSANQGQRPQTQQQEAGQRSSSQGQPRQQNQGQQNQQGERQGEHHVDLTGNAVSDVKKVGSELVGAARDSAASLIDAQRARAADQIVAIGEALRGSAKSFESTGAGALTQYVNQAADQICDFADTVRDRSWSDLAGDVESFARRYPTMFMISALGIGFALGRFLLSSSERTHAGYGSAPGHSGGYRADMRRDAGGAGRTVPSGARAEYGSSVRE